MLSNDPITTLIEEYIDWTNLSEQKITIGACSSLSPLNGGSEQIISNKNLKDCKPIDF